MRRCLKVSSTPLLTCKSERRRPRPRGSSDSRPVPVPRCDALKAVVAEVGAVDPMRAAQVQLALGPTARRTRPKHPTDPRFGNGCVWNAAYCVNKYDQCGILESEVEDKCGAWAECGGVVCHEEYGGYCLVRRRMSNDAYADVWGFSKTERANRLLPMHW